MTVSQTKEPTEFVCNLDAIAPENREAHIALAQRLVLESYLELKELEDGYAFKFAVEEFDTILKYISNERLCCPFFTFNVKITPNHGPIWLSIYGHEQIKIFLKNELQNVKDKA